MTVVTWKKQLCENKAQLRQILEFGYCKIVSCLQSVSGYMVQFPCFIPQMPLAHLDSPLNSEFGKIGSFEESHEDPTEDGYRAPGIRSHYLFGKKQSFVEQ